jgi:hypothetical protein
MRKQQNQSKEIWELSSLEREKFFKGAGMATLLLSEKNEVIACHYEDLNGLVDTKSGQPIYGKTLTVNNNEKISEGMITASCTFIPRIPFR